MFRIAIANLRELARRRDLIRLLVISNLKSSQKNTFLGYLWWLMDPLLLMLVYWVLVTLLGRGGSIPAYPMFLLCTLLPWKSFAGALRQSVAAISKNESLIKQVPFPKAVIPISLVLSNFFECVIGIIPLMAVGILFGVYPTWRYILLPIPLIIMLNLMLGLSLCFSFFGVWFRDLENILLFVTRLWWYLSPGLYAMHDVINKVGDKSWQLMLYKLNPFATIFPAIQYSVYFPGFKAAEIEGMVTSGSITPQTAETWKYALDQGMATGFNWMALGVWFAISVAVLIVGYLMFVNNEHKFGKVL